MHCSHWFLSFALVVKVKARPPLLGGWLHRLLSLLDILPPFSFGQMDSLHCFVWRRESTPSFPSPASSQGRVPPLPALHRQVASLSDKLGQQSRGCGSLNQHSLHAFRARRSLFTPEAQEAT